MALTLWDELLTCPSWWLRWLWGPISHPSQPLPCQPPLNPEPPALPSTSPESSCVLRPRDPLASQPAAALSPTPLVGEAFPRGSLVVPRWRSGASCSGPCCLPSLYGLYPFPSWPKTERKGRNLGRRVRAPGSHGQKQKPSGVALPSPWTCWGKGRGTDGDRGASLLCCLRIPKPTDTESCLPADETHSALVLL